MRTHTLTFGVRDMQTTQHASTCQVLLHPACTTNPDAIKAVQQATGRFVVLDGGRPTLKQPASLPAFEDFGPWGGAA